MLFKYVFWKVVIMKMWKGYTWVDLIVVTGVVVAILVVSILTMAEWYIVVNSVLACLCVFTQAKGKVITQFIGITWSVFYIYTAITQNLWGEVILNLGVIVPMYVYGIINWMKHKQQDDNIVKIAELSKKELTILGCSYIPIFIVVYFLLQALNTAQLLMSTFSFTLLVPAMYLLMRRSKYNNYVFLLQDIVYLILWICVVMQSGDNYLCIVISNIIQIVFDIYAIIEWSKLEKKQKRKGLN